MLIIPAQCGGSPMASTSSHAACPTLVTTQSGTCRPTTSSHSTFFSPRTSDLLLISVFRGSAHIGTELRLKPAPSSSVVSGETHITPGSHVRIESALMTNVSLLHSDEESVKAQQMMRRVQRLPLIGRIVAHGTASYWMALNEVKTGSCEWDDV